MVSFGKVRLTMSKILSPPKILSLDKLHAPVWVSTPSLLLLNTPSQQAFGSQELGLHLSGTHLSRELNIIICLMSPALLTITAAGDVGP